MFNSKRTICKSLLAFGLISVTIAFAVGSEKPATAKTRMPEQNIIKRFIDSIWKRHPKKTLGARHNLFPIAPGVIDTSEIWHNKPMFLWHSASKNQPARLIVREQNSEESQWVQKVNIADNRAFYQGKPLQPGKIYQWKLEADNTSIPWTNFQIMPEKQRARIKTYLHKLEQKYLAETSEEIAQIKAEYFLQYAMKPLLWSDALQALYQVKQPSQNFIHNRQKLIDNISFPVEE